MITRASDGPSEGRSQPGSKGKRKGDSAFDLWLQRGLHEMFDDIAGEPVPEELRKLIEDDRIERSAGSTAAAPASSA